MLEKIITFSLNNRLFIIFTALVLVIVGGYSLSQLSFDAFPDVTGVVVQVNTVAEGVGPEEIEQQITRSIETELSGIPNVKEVRSISKFGLSQITIIFKDKTDVYFARQLVLERIQQVELPEGIDERPKLGPISTGLGEIYHYLIMGKDKNLAEIRSIHDRVIKPKLRSVSGVAEVNSWGGYEKQYQVRVNLLKLIKYSLTLQDVISALKENNANVGGGNIEQAGEVHIVYGVGVVKNTLEIENIVIAVAHGIPIRIQDVAEVIEGHEIRRAAVTYGGEREGVLGLAFMLVHENSRLVAQRIKEKMELIKKSLPEGISIKTVYDRSELVDEILGTVRENLFEGALLVVVILFLLLGNLKGALLVALAIPFSMLFASAVMLKAGIAGSLMSLGAVDFGLIIDSSVIMMENSVRHMSLERNKDKERIEIIKDASIEVLKPALFGMLIIMIVYFPILALEGIEGKLFKPMALTVIFALTGSLILSLTLMPVLASIFLSKKIKHKETIFIRLAKSLYLPTLDWCFRHRVKIITLAVLLLCGASFLFTRLGQEFVPKLDEGSIVINAVRLSGVSVDEQVRYSLLIEKLLKEKFPDEIKDIWTRIGTPEVATDPMGVEVGDIFIMLKSRELWKLARTKQELVNIMAKELEKMPGSKFIFSQPIEMRINELVAGIKTDVGVKIFGDDLEVLKETAEKAEHILKDIKGCADASVEQITGQPVLQIKIDQEAISRYGICVQDVLDIISSLSGKKIGEIREEQIRFPLVVRLEERYRNDISEVENITILSKQGEQVLLKNVADIKRVEGPTTINREWGQRRIVVSCNVRGRDVGSFIKEARERIEENIKFPIGYHLEFGGQFENLQRAQKRLLIVVPIALLLIFFLLYTTFDSTRDALLMFTGVPFALIGGVVSLYLRGMPFTVSAGVGFIALSGVAVLNGLVLISYIRKMIEEGEDLMEAIKKSCQTRLRPILMTALVASLGFIPMALNTGVGAEVQSPLATVVIGGIISSTILTLFVLPVIYSFVGRERTRGAG